ncbi:DNA polymerase III subunit delta [Candidatus Pantoea edessiphila]|uniref:DNA polymerase III subunit delta n=1 Tax=Candidatus Pantoea edessiphila TaxID=2044610 RepID=A0A2P5T2B0_9GAMM|nr:DNA polymerase III subunit delta [Candidatus Pantoea edessiphila]PPI88717.1 DNA polymerase III subunit delta [Candidatus Pantoea edessiphila]
MIKIYAQQLSTQLHKKLHNCYILIGNEPSLINESANLINTIAKKNGFGESFYFIIDNSTNWINLFIICNSLSLFNTKKVINLQFNEFSQNELITKQLNVLSKLLHPEILFIYRIGKLNKNDESSIWFKIISRCGISVLCWKLELNNLYKWVEIRAKDMKLSIDDNSIKLLCHYYEGNLSALTQTMKMLCLQWPDRKLTLSRVKLSISKTQCFSSIVWVNALLEGNIIRAIKILNELERSNNEAILLLNTLQRDILILVKLHYYQQKQKPLCVVMDNCNVWKQRRYLFKYALKRLDTTNLQTIIHLLIKVETSIKQNYTKIVWLQFEMLSFLLCNSNMLPIDFYRVL